MLSIIIYLWHLLHTQCCSLAIYRTEMHFLFTFSFCFALQVRSIALNTLRINIRYWEFETMHNIFAFFVSRRNATKSLSKRRRKIKTEIIDHMIFVVVSSIPFILLLTVLVCMCLCLQSSFYSVYKFFLLRYRFEMRLVLTDSWRNFIVYFLWSSLNRQNHLIPFKKWSFDQHIYKTKFAPCTLDSFSISLYSHLWKSWEKQPSLSFSINVCEWNWNDYSVYQIPIDSGIIYISLTIEFGPFNVMVCIYFL